MIFFMLKMFLTEEIWETSILQFLSFHNSVPLGLTNKKFYDMVWNRISTYAIKQINNGLDNIFEDETKNVKAMIQKEEGFVVGDFINSCIWGICDRQMCMYTHSSITLDATLEGLKIRRLDNLLLKNRGYIGWMDIQVIPNSNSGKEWIIEDKIKYIFDKYSVAIRQIVYYIDRDGKEHIVSALPLYRTINKEIHFTAQNTKTLTMNMIEKYDKNTFKIAISGISYQTIISNSNLVGGILWKYVLFCFDQISNIGESFTYKLVEGDLAQLHNFVARTKPNEGFKIDNDILTIEEPDNKLKKCGVCPVNLVDNKQYHFHHQKMCTEYLFVVNGKKMPSA